jgi:hypothetical protein
MTYPVLVFLTGVTGFRQSNTVQIEHLVSHGYIVVGIDQPYVNAAVTVSGGGVIPGWTRNQVQPLIDQSLTPAPNAPEVNGIKLADGIIPYLAQDVSFTLDRLNDLNNKDPNGILSGHMDLNNTGTFGVSLGAMIASEACSTDLRLKACLMMDAAMPADVVRLGLPQPAMWLTRPANDMRSEKWNESDIKLTLDSMLAVYKREPKGKGYYVQIPGMFHTNFTDAPLYCPIAQKLGFTGSIDARRGFDIVNSYLLAFFNLELLVQPSPLLSGVTKITVDTTPPN